MSDPTFRPEQLFEHQEFLRALARELVHDAASVEDVLQDAYLKALTQPPRSAGALRSWLARVVTNRALNLRREEGRRVRRERATARHEIEIQEDVGEKIATEKRVLEALSRLREPYRTTLWLRWCDGLPPRAIAARLEVGIETVNSRLKRGLADLRAELDQEFGDRKSWCVALAPWIVPRAGGVSVAVLAGAAVVCIALGWWALRPAPVRTSFAVAAPSSVSSRTTNDAPPGERVRAGERALDPVGTSSNAEVAQPFAGLALDARTDEPIPELALEGDGTRALTTADGGFRLEHARGLRVVDGSVPLAFERAGDRLRVEIGPTWRLAFTHALPCAPGELVAELDGALSTSVRDGTDPWVRFPALPALSLLARAERSVFELVVRSRDGRFEGRARVHARSGIQPGLVRIALVERAEEPVSPAAVVSGPTERVAGRVTSRVGLPLAGSKVRARRVDDPKQMREAEISADGRFEFTELPRASWAITPPLDDGYSWSPPRSIVIDAPASGLAFARLDDVRASRVRVRAFEELNGARLERVRFALLPDRTGEGKELALAYQGDPSLRDVSFDAIGYDALPTGTRAFWLVERDGFLSARGTLADMRRDGADLVVEVRLAPCWKTHLSIVGDERGARVPLAGVKLVTAAGKLLAESLDDGGIDLELAYDPGRLNLVYPGWSVASWEGWWRGKPRSALDPHHVVLVRD